MIKEFAVGGESYLGIETPDWKGRMILSVGSILLELTEKKTGWNLLRSPETIEDLKFQPEVYGELVAYNGFLRSYAMVGVEAQTF